MVVRHGKDQRGATVAEYALVLAIVVVGLILVLGQLGETLRGKILDVVDRLKDAPTSP
ncbi:MAG: Flp family type IVb pilin [Firmicutes bacterium]|nr:Flp family type IVb pilin [Candidatus Fermentithermobacillaceae bacterium]